MGKDFAIVLLPLRCAYYPIVRSVQIKQMQKFYISFGFDLHLLFVRGFLLVI
jgi:hypothetical protein